MTLLSAKFRSSRDWRKVHRMTITGPLVKISNRTKERMTLKTVLVQERKTAMTRLRGGATQAKPDC